MGYYTRHNLEVPFKKLSLITELREECEGAKWAFNDNGECEERCKWYSHEKDLRAFSAEHPDVLFTLKGEGEEPGDLWVEYYKAGRMQKCAGVITFASYDETELE